MKKVITYGTFDLLHQGHVNLLKNAKKLGDYLIVGITSEGYDMYRGKLNVKQSLSERIENVKKLGIADEIVVEEYEGQKIDDIVLKKIDIFAIGSDWVGRFDYLREYCEVVYLERTKGISSTQLRDEQHPMINFGIVGCGRIANRFVVESKFVSGNNVEGVFNVYEEPAKQFVQKHNLNFYSTDYDDFISRVNAVYIASPHHTHYEYAKKALLSGKHVLCEKPMALSKTDAAELFNIAREKGLILMEALKTAYCPGFQRLVSCAKSGKIGQIVNVDAAFTKLVASNTRERQNDGVGGSMFELASYPLLAIFKLMGTNFENVSYTSYLDPNNGVDLFTKVDMLFKNGMATGKVGLGVKREGDLVIAGTRGYIYVPAPWWKTDYFELRYEDLNENEKYFYKFSGDGLRYEIVEFMNRISIGAMDKQMCEISEAIADIMERYRKEENVVTF